MKKATIAVMLLLAGITAFSQTKNFIDKPFIEVQGSADSLVTPNQIFIRITLSEKDTRDRVPLEETESKMVAALQALGINTERNLQTSDILSNYRYYLLKKKDILKSKEYILEVPTAAVASKVFIELENLEISNASVERVDHTEMESIRNSCRSKAIESAKKKAFSLTQPIGQSVGNALHIVDNDGSLQQQLAGNVAGIRIRGAVSATPDKFGPPKIEFEKIKVTTGVTVVFELK